jgi:hypothetical protein
MVHFSRTTVRDVIHLYQREGSVDAKRLGKCGRRRLLSQRDERNIGRRRAANPRATAKEAQDEAGGSAFTIFILTGKRALKRQDRCAYRLRKAPALNKAQMTTRLRWCRKRGG